MVGEYMTDQAAERCGSAAPPRAHAARVADGNGRLLPSVGFTLLLPTVGGRSVQRR
jgi:hypothetical protein